MIKMRMLERVAIGVAAMALGCSSSDDGSGDGMPGAKAAGPNPAWLLGLYEKGTRVENNIPFTSEDEAIELTHEPPLPPRYRYKTGRTFYMSTGTWAVRNGVLAFEGGPLAGRSFPLATSFSKNCRIFDFGGTKLWRASAVQGCPLGDGRLGPDECAVVGRWSMETKSGGSSNSLETSRSITLEPDHFFRVDESRTSCLCSSSACKCLRNEPRTSVGTWSRSGTTLEGPPSVEGYKFTPGAQACAAPASGNGGGVGVPSTPKDGGVAGANGGGGQAGTGQGGAGGSDGGGGVIGGGGASGGGGVASDAGVGGAGGTAACALASQSCGAGLSCALRCVPGTAVPAPGCVADQGGTAAHGQACGSAIGITCAKGHLCVSSAGQSACRRFCERDIDCPSGRACQPIRISVNACVGSGPPDAGAAPVITVNICSL